MKSVPLFQVDAFTRRKFNGNPAGVVLNAESLSEIEMQQIARELNNSETAFLYPGVHSDYELGIRYFTPSTEVPICGHATIAAMYVYARQHRLSAGTVRLKTQVGILAMKIGRDRGDYRITMQQGQLHFQDPLAKAIRQRIIRSLGADESMLLLASPVQVVSTGHSKVIIPFKDRSFIDDLRPDFPALAGISGEIGCNGYFVGCFQHGAQQTETYGRMFAPAIGINEDPVTGNANGPFGAYLVKHRLVACRGDTFQFLATQGDAVNRPGSMLVRVALNDEEPVGVQIEGSAVVVYSTNLTI